MLYACPTRQAIVATYSKNKNIYQYDKQWTEPDSVRELFDE